MGVLASSENILTPKFRLSFPSVFEPNVYGGKSKYLITMLYPKDQDLGPFKTIVGAAIKQAFGEDRSKWPQLQMPFGDGDTKDYDGYAGHVFVKASSEYPPGVVDAGRNDIINKSDVYAGMYARAQINAYVWEFGGNHGVSFGLQNLQVLRDGDAFGNRVSATNAFDDGYTAPEGFQADSGDSDVNIFGEAPPFDDSDIPY